MNAEMHNQKNSSSQKYIITLEEITWINKSADEEFREILSICIFINHSTKSSKNM